MCRLCTSTSVEGGREARCDECGELRRCWAIHGEIKRLYQPARLAERSVCFACLSFRIGEALRVE